MLQVLPIAAKDAVQKRFLEPFGPIVAADVERERVNPVPSTALVERNQCLYRRSMDVRLAMHSHLTSVGDEVRSLVRVAANKYGDVGNLTPGEQLSWTPHQLDTVHDRSPLTRVPVPTQSVN